MMPLDDSGRYGSQSPQPSIPLRDLGRLQDSPNFRQIQYDNSMIEDDGPSLQQGRHWERDEQRRQDLLNGQSSSATPSNNRYNMPRPFYGRSFSEAHGSGQSADGRIHSASQNGLSFGSVDSSGIGMGRGSAQTGRNASQIPTIYSSEELETYSVTSLDDGGSTAQPSTFSDTAGLTAPVNMQAISGARVSAPRHRRGRTYHGIQFLAPNWNSPRGANDEEPSTVEAGLHGTTSDDSRRSHSRDRSLSLAVGETTLSRAGTVMRKMSQRVVNLSNEPELVEKSMRKKSMDETATRYDPEPVPPLPPKSPGSVHQGAQVREEKQPEQSITIVPDVQPEFDTNPLRGRSLGIFPPNSTIRVKLCNLLIHPATEPVILVLIILQTILLSIESATDAFEDPRTSDWGSSWIDYALFGLFCVYTVELIVRTIVSGFIINPVEYSTIKRQENVWQSLKEKFNATFSTRQRPQLKRPSTMSEAQQPSLLRSFTTHAGTLQDGDSKQQQRVRLAHRAFLRHSFNRLDFVAVVSFWISFVLSVLEIETSKSIYVFRMLSCLRILRLLGLTSGTSIILRSLKKATPLLVNVAFLIGFFWLLFAIVGVQSFKSSLRRTCVWVDPLGAQPNFTLNAVDNFQFCGGHLDEDGQKLPWITAEGENGTFEHKGYLCPVGSFCVQGDNPYNGTVNFDNALQSLELVFVVMSSNSFSDLLYYLTDSDYLAAALFFAAGIVFMNLWLISLLIAVITSSFQVIREESKRSAFTVDESEPHVPEELQKSYRRNNLRKYYDLSSWIWIGIIAYGIICQCLRTATMSRDTEIFIDTSETVVTFALGAEILIRLAVDRRQFFRSKRNLFDLFLAVVTCVIQIPPIRNSGQPYAWLTVFQILRIYRLVLALPITRNLITIVLGNTSGLLNLILFVFLLTFLAAIFASQLFRGELPMEDANGDKVPITFSSTYNSFLGMYQILSSEDWTSILYYITSFSKAKHTAWIGATFCIIWFILANFIVLKMFIAVIQESFDVSEDEKRLQQVRSFLERKEMGGVHNGNLSLSKIFKFNEIMGRRKDPLDFGQATTELLLKDAVVRDFLDEQDEGMERYSTANGDMLNRAPTAVVVTGKASSLKRKLIGWFSHQEPNPFYSRLQFKADQDLDPRQMAKEVVQATDRRKRAQREFLLKYPRYNISLYIFSPKNPIRRLCQRIVGPGRGIDRIDGVAPSAPLWYSFSAFVYLAIVAMVVLACVTTPVYQKEYFKGNEYSAQNWFAYTDLGFAILFTVEALIKIIADGMFFAPNAYFRTSWGFIDGIVLITLWVNVITLLSNNGEASRAVGAFKALRALRLLNVSDSAKDTFHAVIVRGGRKVASAAFVSLSLLIPFAIYGVNLFAGKMEHCNDERSDIIDLNDCVNEYKSVPYNWEILAPRRASNPYYDFDDFPAALFILFQIVSQEGWTDVMWSAESITGVFRQPRLNASKGNAVLFVIFNLLGAVFVLTLFVSVFMRNYTEQTGVAFLTTEQRSWLELRKLLRKISPSKRPSPRMQRQTWHEWCYHRSVRKTGRWQRFITFVLVLHLVLLCLEFHPSEDWWDMTRDYIFLLLTLIYIANIAIRIVGLSWTRFRKSSWDVYSLFSIFGTFVTTILLLTRRPERVFPQIYKLCLVSVTLLLIPRNNQLDQLFKTAAASFTSIANLLATWIVMFLVFAIALTQAFGLTRFNGNETGNLNFRSVPNALVLLFRMSVGEGWNEIMEDFATVEPPNCVMSDNYFESDCGSAGWARFLFIAWNILSMYIFVNLFVSLIFESFSYVYQRSSGSGAVSRDEIRRFKQAWTEFDPNGTGYISKSAFPRLLGELSGIFEMRVYHGEFTVGRMIERCKVLPRQSTLSVDEPKAKQIDLHKLNRTLANIPVEEIRKRRMRLNIFYEEVLVSADPDRGISFNALLMILAHYKVINDNKSLKLEEFLRRRARLQRVEEAVRRETVIGFFDMLYWSSRFRKAKKAKFAKNITTVPRLDIPEIFVDGSDSPEGTDANSLMPSPAPSASPQMFAYDGGMSTGNDVSQSPLPESPRRRNNQTQQTATHSRAKSDNVRTSLRPASDLFTGEARLTRAISQPSLYDPDLLMAGEDGYESSNSGAGSASHSRAGSNVDPQSVLDVLESSAWGESIRRSFSTRRPSRRRH